MPFSVVGPSSKAQSTSFEQLLASNDDINFADEDEDSDSRAHGGSSGADECPNSYDYCIHPNNYLVRIPRTHLNSDRIECTWNPRVP